MFRRIGNFFGVIGISMLMGAFLVLVFDFLSIITLFDGVSDGLMSFGEIGYLLASVVGIGILILPIDWYYYIFDTGMIRQPSILVSIYLLIFFGIIGAWIGLRSTSNEIKNPLKEMLIMSFGTIIMIDILLLLLIQILSSTIIGILLKSLLIGIIGRSTITFLLCSVIENGIVLSIFSYFFLVILEDRSDKENRIYCDDGNTLCEL